MARTPSFAVVGRTPSSVWFGGRGVRGTVADEGVRATQRRFQLRAPLADVRGERGVGVLLERRQRHRAAEWVAQERARVQRLAGRERPCVHDLRAAHARRQREAAGQRLAEANQVRHHARVLAGEKRAGAVETGVNLIGDEQHAVRVAHRAQHRQKLPRRHHAPAATLHRLHENAPDPARANHRLDLPAQSVGQPAAFRRIRQQRREVPQLRAKRLAKER